MDFEENNKKFNYCGKVDLHALDDSIPLDMAVAIAAEHGFRGIVVGLNKIEELVKLINNPTFGDKSIKPICAIDYPFGSASMDVRIYSIHSAKEKGAKEIEIVAPYSLIYDELFRKVFEDAESIMKAANKLGITVKYVVDRGNPAINDAVQTKLLRMISATKIPVISTSLGYYDKSEGHSDEIIRMRAVKNKTSCQIKVYIPNCGVDDLASYAKAGTDIIGLDWNQAACIVHAYEDMVEKGT